MITGAATEVQRNSGQPHHHRNDLARLAAALYPAQFRIDRAPLIAPRSWLPTEPVDLADLDLTWVPDAPPLRVTGGEPETQPVRPMRVPGQQYDRYTFAIRYLDPPSLFENRTSYRLLGLAWTGLTGAMRFGLATYFDKLDISEAVGHELAQAYLRNDGDVSLRDLPFRSLIGDPFDLTRSRRWTRRRYLRTGPATGSWPHTSPTGEPPGPDPRPVLRRR